MSKQKIWGGRFDKPTNSLMEIFSSSIHFDSRLFDADIAVNKAWAEALQDIGVYKAAEVKKVHRALDQISTDYHHNSLPFQASDEDIHSFVERQLTERLGELGRRIHTGRSRNDQVATDVRIWLRQELCVLIDAVKILQGELVALAEKHTVTVLAGQTHFRQAQPVSFAHYLLSFFFQLQRDRERLQQAGKRCNRMPLGSGAVAGAAYAIDRKKLAQSLSFDAPTDNSIDATADRDFITEAIFSCAQIMVHLSRLAEDWIVWSSEPFRFIDIDQAFATGSSMMPQKKNPDSLELVRGKSARVVGHLTSLLTLMKGIPTAYVRDLQEDKEPLFDTIVQTMMSILIVNGVVKTCRVDAEKMRHAIEPALYATDIADYLVMKGLPFRQAHEITGIIVGNAEAENIPLNELPLQRYKTYCKYFDEEIYKIFDPIASLQKRNLEGGTGALSVKKQIRNAKKYLKA